MHVNDGRLEPCVKKCTFLKHPDGAKGYRLWHLDAKSPKVIISRDVTFDEWSTFNLKLVSCETEIAINTSKKLELELTK